MSDLALRVGYRPAHTTQVVVRRGAELAPGTSALAYSLGFVVSTGCLHGVGILLGLKPARPLGEVAVLGAGLFVAAAVAPRVTATSSTRRAHVSADR